MAEKMTKKDCDLAGKDPKAVLTPDEFAHFNEGMLPKNKSIPADEIDMKRAVQSVKQDLNRLFS